MNDDHSMSTPDMIEALKQLRQQMADQAHQRHTINNEIMKTIGSHSAHVSRYEDRMVEFEMAVKALTNRMEPLGALVEDVRLIKVRLIGDPSLQSDGVIQDLVSVMADVRDLKEKAKEVEFFKRAFIWMLSVIGGLGAIITFVKGTDFMHWLIK